VGEGSLEWGRRRNLVRWLPVYGTVQGWVETWEGASKMAQ